MRVVLDANIFVSAMLSAGPSHRIVQAALSDSDLSALICPALLAEVEDVLGRPRLQARVSAGDVEAFIDDLLMLLEFVPDPTQVPPATRDPKDDYIVALARQHKADYIVTGDKDLLEWDEQTPPVVAPAALEQLFAELE